MLVIRAFFKTSSLPRITTTIFLSVKTISHMVHFPICYAVLLISAKQLKILFTEHFHPLEDIVLQSFSPVKQSEEDELCGVCKQCRSLSVLITCYANAGGVSCVKLYITFLTFSCVIFVVENSSEKFDFHPLTPKPDKLKRSRAKINCVMC